MPRLPFLVPSKSMRIITRRRVITGGLGLAAVSMLGTGGYAAGLAAYDLAITRYAPVLPGWPAGRRLSIAVVADLHAGGPNMGLARVRALVDATLALRAD